MAAKTQQAKTTTSKPGYKVPEESKNHVIVQVCLKGYDRETGERIGKPYTYTTDVGFWNSVFYPNIDSQNLEVLDVYNLPKDAIKPTVAKKK